MTYLPDEGAPGEAFEPEMEELLPFFDLSFGLLCIAGFNGYFRWLNNSWSQTLGYSVEQLLSQPFLYYVHPDDRQNTLRQMKQLAAGEQLSAFENRYLAADGEYKWLLWTARPFPEKGLIYAVARDVTYRRQAEEALRISEQRLASIINLSADAIITIDKEQEIVFFNPAAEHIFGYRTSEVLGKPLSLLLPARFVDSHKEYVGAFARSDSGYRAMRAMGKYRELSGLRKDGTEFPLEAAIGRTEINGHLLMTVTLRDITERDWAERALLEANAQLEEINRRARYLAQMAQEANQAKSAFLANMSHEIRTPMNAVIGMTGLLRETRLTPEQEEYVDTVRSSSESLLDLLNDILDFSKIEAGRMDLEEQPFNLRDAVESALDLVAVKAARKGLDLAYYLHDQTPSMIISDVTRLRQVLVNLLGNAVKFTSEGEVAVTVQAKRLEPVQAGDAERYELQFAVRDTGIGIPPGRVDAIFLPFSQADVSTTREYGGTGLGLAISRRLVEIMDGRMWVESEGPGTGSCFFFTIVITAAADQPPDCLVGPQAELEGKRLLLVDDNVTNRQMMAGCTTAWGMTVREAATAREAISLLRQGQRFDAALLDMRLGDMDGIKLARVLRQLPSGKTLHLIAMTPIGYRHRSDDLVNARIYKPVKVEQLYETLLLLFGGTPEIVSDEGAPALLDKALAERRPLRILVAEDNLINQKVALRLLEKLGYSADVAADGQEVLEALERRPYDLVFMDVQMPRMDGLEATRQILETWPEQQRPRIVAMTANALQGHREQFLAAGMDDYVSKPVRVQELIRALRETAPLPQQHSLSRESSLRQGTKEGLDTETLQLFRYTMEDQPGLFRQMVELYLEQSTQHLLAMKEALAARDAVALEIEAHTFKSTSALIGALYLSQLCEDVETAAHRWPSGDFPDATLAALETDLEKAAVELALVQEALAREVV